MAERGTEIPIPRAVGYIVLATLLIGGSSLIYLLGPRIIHSWRASQTHYQLTHLLPHPMGTHTLPTAMLADILDLSDDGYVNLYAYDLRIASQQLAKLPIFAFIELSKRPPHTLAIAYTLRAPAFRLIDYDNTAVTDDGTLIPLYPYYPPQELPHLIVGYLPTSPWGYRLPQATVTLLQRLLPAIQTAANAVHCSSWTLDLRDLYANALGEIVLNLEWTPKGQYHHYLRLTAADFIVQLERYTTLYDRLPATSASTVIDLRLTDALLTTPG